MTNPTREQMIEAMKAAAERMGLDLEDIQEMIDDVLADCLEKSNLLNDAVQTKNVDDIRTIAHDIKGSTANYGLNEASALALQIEKSHTELPEASINQLSDYIKYLTTLNLGAPG